MAQWFIVSDFGEEGPYTPQQLRDLTEGGIITPETRVRSDGMKDPFHAKEVNELFPLTNISNPRSTEIPKQRGSPKVDPPTADGRKRYYLAASIVLLCAIPLVVVASHVFSSRRVPTSEEEQSKDQSVNKALFAALHRAAVGSGYQPVYEDRAGAPKSGRK